MWPEQKATLLLITFMVLPGGESFRRHFEARQSTNSNIPLWKQRVSTTTDPWRR